MDAVFTELSFFVFFVLAFCTSLITTFVLKILCTWHTRIFPF